MAKCSRFLLLAGVGAALLPTPAPAQEDPRLSAIEAQIKALQTELQRVRRDLAARDGEVRAARKDAADARANQARLAKAPPGTQATPGQPPSGQGGVQRAGGGTDSSPAQSSAPASTSASGGTANPGGLGFPQGRPTFTSNDGRFSAAVGLQLHYDLGGYFQGSNRPDNRSVTRLNTFGQNLRRARIPFVFKYDDFQVNVTPDFGGSPDGQPTLYEANFNWSPIKPLVATLGYYKPQLTLQDSMSSNDCNRGKTPGER